MDLSEFNNDYLNSVSEKLLREKNKHIILMGNFNVDLLKYTADTSTAQFQDQMYSSSLLPQTTSPTRSSTKSKTLVDNTFSTDSPEEPISGNIITSISDHLAQVLLFPIEKTKGKKEIYKSEFQKPYRK